MFDIAFSELVVIALVALIVVGPARLPKVARTAGHLWGRVQRYAQNVKHDVMNDMAMEDARKMREEFQRQIDEVGHQLEQDGRTLQQQLLQAQHRKPPSGDSAPDTSSK